MMSSMKKFATAENIGQMVTCEQGSTPAAPVVTAERRQPAQRGRPRGWAAHGLARFA